MAQAETADVLNSEDIHRFYCEACVPCNASVIDAMGKLSDDGYSRKTHYFNGRYENLYIDPAVLPGLDFILDQAIRYAAKILGRPKDTVRAGFWLNIMREGDITSRHSHDDNDELLSGVYYLQVPEESGMFRYFSHEGSRSIEPVVGTFLFFHPGLVHEVTRHGAGLPRISMGLNIGPA